MDLEESYENLVSNHADLETEVVNNLSRLASFLIWKKTGEAYTTIINGFNLKIENNTLTSDDGRINIRGEGISHLYESLRAYCL